MKILALNVEFDRCRDLRGPIVETDGDAMTRIEIYEAGELFRTLPPGQYAIVPIKIVVAATDDETDGADRLRETRQP